MSERPVEVHCYAGARGKETPRRVRCDGEWKEVVELLARWIEEGQERGMGRRLGFQVRLSNGERWRVIYDEVLDIWSGTSY
jgi:hypothetical protein